MNELEKYRKRIDEIDQELSALLGERFEIVRAVGKLKSENDIKIVQSERAETVINNAVDLAHKNNIDPEFIRDFYVRMIDLAHVIEHDILDKHKKS